MKDSEWRRQHPPPPHPPVDPLPVGDRRAYTALVSGEWGVTASCRDHACAVHGFPCGNLLVANTLAGCTHEGCGRMGYAVFADFTKRERRDEEGGSCGINWRIAETGMRHDPPTCALGRSPDWTQLYTVRLVTPSNSLTSLTWRNFFVVVSRSITTSSPSDDCRDPCSRSAGAFDLSSVAPSVAAVHLKILRVVLRPSAAPR